MYSSSPPLKCVHTVALWGLMSYSNPWRVYSFIVCSRTHVYWIFLFQDWEFPHFMGDLDVNLPGLSTTQLKIKLPVCKSIFKDEYHIHITGTSTHLCSKWGTTAHSSSLNCRLGQDGFINSLPKGTRCRNISSLGTSLYNDVFEDSVGNAY